MTDPEAIITTIKATAMITDSFTINLITASLANVAMTTGLITVGEKGYIQHRIEEKRVVVRPMDIDMTVDAVDFDRHTGVCGNVSRRNAVTLQANAVSGLGQQALVG
jgi:hypothetical protein